MKQGKVLEILGANEWNWPHGKLYYINMKLDNWETISLGKKKADAFKVWDTVCYEDYVDDKGKTRYKEVQDEQPKKTFDSSNNNRWAMVWMSYKLAFELVYKKEDDFQKAVLLANAIFDQAMITYGSEQTTTDERESAKDDKLPF